MIHRGQLYWARLDKRRPALVLSPDYRNEHASDLIVIPTSTRLRYAPTLISLKKREGGLPEPSVLHCEQITTLRKSLLDPEPIGPPLSPKRMIEVERAVLCAIGLFI